MFDRKDPAVKAAHAAPVDQDGPSGNDLHTKPLSDRELQRLVNEATLEELRKLNATQSAMAAHSRSQLVNDVLDVELAIFDVNGVVAREFRTMVGTVGVHNHGTAAITVSSSPQGAGAPSSGRGVTLVPPGVAVAIPVGSHVFTIYGLPGQSVSIQAFTKAFGPDYGVGPSVISGQVTVSGTVTALDMRPGTPVDNGSSAAAGAAVTATLAAAAAKVTYLTGFEVTWNATGTGTVNDVVTVTAGGTVFTYNLATVAGAGGQLIVEFSAPVPASAVNTAITVALPATASRAADSIVAHGFQL